MLAMCHAAGRAGPLTNRSLQDADFPDLLTVRNAVAPGRRETEGDPRHLDAMLRARGLEPAWLLAMHDDRMVGYADVVGTGEAQGVDVGVAPEARGRGIGTALWERSASVLRERGARVARCGSTTRTRRRWPSCGGI